MNRALHWGFALALACSTTALAADAPKSIGWDDLAVKIAPADNPFARLALDQLEALADVAALRDRKARGIALSTAELATERASVAKLEKAGIDVTALLAKRDEIAARQDALAREVNRSLDGELVRLPGYVLPVEFSGKQVIELLLVPWAGACIHTPPPPPNQIVRVKLDKPYEPRGAFDAVWVTGRLAARSAKTSVYITDGTTEVDVGYSLRASGIEAYR